MKTIRTFLSENFQFLVVKFSIYLNRRVFVMLSEGFARQLVIIMNFVLSVDIKRVVCTSSAL